MSLLSPSTLGIVVSLILLAGYLVYRATFPKPIPGIPYVRASADRPFGDVPDALNYHAQTSEMISFLALKCIELNSPIVQVFMRPFSRPWVVLADCREAQDIMVRRTRDFDRSEFFSDLFLATVPHNQVVMKTTDQWRFNRRLMADTMSPQFLHMAAEPRFYTAFTVLIELWHKKAVLANGHPTSVATDVEEAMLDAICAVALGRSTEATKAQLDLVTTLQQLSELSKKGDDIAVFPRAPVPAQYTALKTIADSSEIPMKSPFGRTHHKFATQYYPTLSAAIKQKGEMVNSQLHASWQKFTNPGTTEDDVKSAADLIVAREVMLAKKENRAPQHDSAVVRDELFGFLQAGHDTTSTSIEWGLKFLTKHQDVQHKLRSSLRDTFMRAAANEEAPLAEDIAKTQTPYLDAFIEEFLRFGNTAAANVRVATTDTEVLGHRIPRGTDVFMLTSGPSYTAPALPIDDRRRSATSQRFLNSTWNGEWDASSLGEFLPERWLVENDRGETEFDPRAGPQHVFGAGLRSCFGRKLAHLGLRIIFTLIVWNFELQHLPAELDNFKAKDVLTHRPQEVYLRLAEV